MRPEFTLLVVATEDGLIARHPAHGPADWASPEEQALFFAAVEAADWAVMGRRTHEAADRPDRHRVILSAAGGAGDWRRPTQLWLDPRGRGPADLAAMVAAVRPMRRALILGGTGVHGWFLDADAIDAVRLTVEPLRFGAGLPIFPGDGPGDPVAAFTGRGFRATGTRTLNDRGTRLVELVRG